MLIISRVNASESRGQYLTYRIVFVVNFLLCYLVMKIVSAILSPASRGSKKDFFLSPYLSVRSLHYQGLDKLSSILSTCILSTFLTAIFATIGREVFTELNYWQVLLIAPVILFMTEALGALGQILFFSFTPKSFPIHHRPLSSPNLGQFWGRHWNLWVQDWLKDISHSFRGKKFRKLMVTFLVSGFFHEVMVNFPYWLMYRKSYFGTMMLYFVIQAAGLEFEKRFLKSASPFIKRLFMFLVVFLPSPLFVNVPILTFLGFMHE